MAPGPSAAPVLPDPVLPGRARTEPIRRCGSDGSDGSMRPDIGHASSQSSSCAAPVNAGYGEWMTWVGMRAR